MQDIRFALRSFAKNPWFTLVAVLSLAIGIGANTSIFSVANALLLRPLPYSDPDRLVILWNRSPGLGIAQDWFSTAQYFDIRNSHSGFEQVAIAIGGTYNLTGSGEPERVGAVRVSSNLLPMLGARPAVGRLLTQEEDAPGLPATAVLTDGMWSRRFGRDPRVVGTSILINGQTYQIVGILPQHFSLPQEVVPLLDGTEQADIFLPLPLTPAAASLVRDHEDYNLIGKLKPGVSITQAQAEMDTITASLRRQFPENYPPNGGLTFSIVPLLEQVVGNIRRSLWVLLGAVGFVLLIACANVANLMLSRAVARQQEIAVRAALGASRWDIIRQLLAESLLISFFGGALGVLICVVSLQAIHVLGTKSIPRLQDVGIDGRVLLFTMFLSIFSGILFGLFPALRVSRLDLNSTLKDASRGTAGASAVWGRGNNFRRLLVVSELALSVVLLIGAGLLIRSFARLENVRPGFSPRGVLTFDLTMSGRKYNDKQSVLNIYRQLWEQLEHSHGGVAAGGVTSLPLSEAFAWTPITVEGRVPLPGEKFLNADERVVAGRYFDAMGIPLRRGRFFNEQDDLNKPIVVIVDEYMAEQLWPGQDPIGKRIHIVELQSKRSVADGGGRGRAREAGFARLRSADRFLRGPHAISHACDDRCFPRRHELGCAAREFKERIAEARSGPADVPRADHGPAGERVAGAPAFFDAAAGSVRRHRAGAGDDRHLRRDGVPGQSGQPRTWDPHCAGRYSAKHFKSGCEARDGSRGRRSHDRPGRGFFADTTDSKLAIWR
jgi:predicted permease